MLQNFLAWIRIELGSFYEQNVDFFWFFISVLALAAVFIPLISTLRMGKIPRGKERYKLSPPDIDVRERAAESLKLAAGIETREDAPESLALFRKMLEERYPGVFQTFGFDIYGAGSLLFYWPSKSAETNEPAVFCSHFDVDLKKTKPAPKKEDEYIEKSLITGPGAAGGKCNVIAMLEAAEYLIRAGYAPTKRDIYFAFGHDGESGGQNGMFNIARMFYRKKIRPAFVLYASGRILPFAASNRSVASAAIGVTEKGRLKLKLVASGSTGKPTERKNKKKGAVEKDPQKVLEEALSRIEAAPVRYRITDTARRYYKIMAPALTFDKRFAVGNLPFTGGLLFRLFRNEPSDCPMLTTTIDVRSSAEGAKAKSGPLKAEALLDIRLLNGDSAGFVVDYLRDITSDLPVSIHELETWEPSAISDTQTEAYRMIYRAVKKRFGRILIAPAVAVCSNGARHFERVCDRVYRMSPLLLEARNLSEQNDQLIRDASLGAAVETYISLIKSAGSEL